MSSRPPGGADSDDSDEEAGPLWTPPCPPGGAAAGLGADAASLREKILQGAEVGLHEIESFSQRLQALHHRSALSSQA